MKGKIKIVFVYGALGGGGAQRQFNLLVNNIDRERFEPIVFVIGQKKEACIDHIKKYPEVSSLDEVGKKEEFSKFLSYRSIHKSCRIDFFERQGVFKTQKILLSRLKILNPDIIFSITPLAATYATLPAFFYRKCKIIHGVRGNGILLNYKFNIPNLYHLLSQPLIDYFICNSNALMLNAKKSGYLKSKLKCVYNGIPTFFDKLNTTKEKDIVHIGMIARFVPLKNHKFFLKVIKGINTKNNFKVHLYGSGRLENELKSYVINNDLADRIIFEGWVSDVSNILKEVDLVCLTSSFEGFNNSISEAQMHGIPVVTTNCSGSDEIVQSGTTGYVVNIDDSDGFSNKLVQLIDDKELRKQFSEKAYERSRRLFSVENMVLNYESFFIKILKTND